MYEHKDVVSTEKTRQFQRTQNRITIDRKREMLQDPGSVDQDRGRGGKGTLAVGDINVETLVNPVSAVMSAS